MMFSVIFSCFLFLIGYIIFQVREHGTRSVECKATSKGGGYSFSLLTKLILGGGAVVGVKVISFSCVDCFN